MVEESLIETHKGKFTKPKGILKGKRSRYLYARR